MTPDIDELLEQAMELPYGRARSRLLEEACRYADAQSDLDLGFWIRDQLCTAYTMGGEPRKLLVPFSWCLAEHDRDPARYARFTHSLLWEFKWVCALPLRFPEISVADTSAMLDQMQQRYLAGGHSLQPVHQARCRIADHAGNDAEAAEQFRLWRVTPRGELSDCEGCDPTDQAEYLVACGRYDEALQVTERVLQGELRCREQPQAALTSILPALVATGRLQEAADAHLRAYRELRSMPGELGPISSHIAFCARTGNEARAVEIVQAQLHRLEEPDTIHAEMTFCASASMALERLASLQVNQTVRWEGNDVPADEAATRLRARAVELAAQFDARNRSTRQSERVNQLLDPEPWVEFVALSPVARRTYELRRQAQQSAPPKDPAQALRQGESAGQLPQDSAVDVSSLATAELLDYAEERWLSEDPDAAGQAWDAFEERLSEQQQSRLDQARLIEGRALQTWETDAQACYEKLQQALVLFEQSDAPLRSLRVRARLGSIQLDRGEVDSAVATAEEPMRTLMHDDDVARRNGWGLRLGVLLLRTGRFEEGDRVVAEVRAREGLTTADRARAGLLHGDLLLALDRAEEAAAAFSEFLAHHAAGVPSWYAHGQRARAYLAIGALQPAEEDLVEATAQATAYGETEMAATYRVLLAQAYQGLNRLTEAAESAEEALPTLIRAENLGGQADAHALLADVYAALGDHETALSHQESVVAIASEFGADGWLPQLLENEAALLEELGRNDEASQTAWLAAHRYGEQDRILEQARALRRVGRNLAAIDPEDAEEAFVQSEELFGALPFEPEIAFHLAGIHSDRAEGAAQRNDIETAIRHARLAEDVYRVNGMDELARRTLVLRLSWGDSAELDFLRQQWRSLECGDYLWHELGYLLADALRGAGIGHEAAEVEATLQE